MQRHFWWFGDLVRQKLRLSYVQDKLEQAPAFDVRGEAHNKDWMNS